MNQLSDNGNDISIEKFRNRIAQAVHWHKLILEEKTKASALWKNVSLPQGGISSLSDEERNEYVNKVLNIRLTQIQDRDYVLNAESLITYTSGRLVIMFPDATLSDGTAQIESENYFNFQNYPPPTTWLYYVGEKKTTYPMLGHIISWVAPQFVTQAINGIEVCPDESVLFMDNPRLNLCYKTILNKQGLLV